MVVQLLLGRRAELTEVMDTEEAERRMVEEIRQCSGRGGPLRTVTEAVAAS